jgi:DNA uptake protein ComE-like DNA-binding protein
MLARLKRWIQSTIGLSSSEANAMMILLPGMFIIIFSEPAYRWIKRPSSPIDIKEQMILDSLVISMETAHVVREPAVSLAHFNPNTASFEELISLGIPEEVGKRIIQYRTKGGEFHIKSDFSKIYGLDPNLFQSLAPSILLPEKIEKEVPLKKETQIITVQYDLNKTDTVSLKTIKGIGTVLSKRIIKYRESLGGFINLNQLKEVYGLDSIVLESLNLFYVADDFLPDKISINSATEKDLSSHPYISNRDAKAIITYRLQHGQFQNLNDLLKIKTLKESDVARLVHYISF